MSMNNNKFKNEGEYFKNNKLITLLESEYSLHIFEFTVKCVVSKRKGGTRAETFSEIRAIPYVTIVRPLGTYNETKEKFYTDIVIKFVYNGTYAGTPKKAARRIMYAIKRIQAVEQVVYIKGSYTQT